VLAGALKAADVAGKRQAVVSVQGAKLDLNGEGGIVKLSGVAVSAMDVMASNGVIHVLDGVLFPNLVDTVAGYDDGTNKFSTLAAIITKAGASGVFSQAGPLTVFAPTDAAFASLKAALGDAAYDAIFANAAKVTKILMYHVLPRAIYSPDVAPGAVQTVQGGALRIAVAGGGVTLADSIPTAATVILADLPNRNGVIHAIDKVLIPADL